MALTVKTNEQSTAFPSYVMLDEVGLTSLSSKQNDLLTGGAGSVYNMIVQNEAGSTTFYIHFYDDRSPTSSSDAVMKLRMKTPGAAVRETHVLARFGVAFSTACSVAASTAADATGSTGSNCNLILLGD